MANDLTIYTGLPGTGKTSALIKAMNEHQNAGGKVVLFLSAEREELTSRPNVRPGGLMGCRNPALKFKIDYVLRTEEAVEILNELEPNTLAVFDEAQYFNSNIVETWIAASSRGVKIVVGMPSREQQTQLSEKGIIPIELKAPCTCGKRNATSVAYDRDLIYPIHLCDDCASRRRDKKLAELFEEVRQSKPFPGEKKTYQPFYELSMEGWQFVRPDSQARFQLIQNAMRRCDAFIQDLQYKEKRSSYLDLGCCSGFFCDAMETVGFRSTGVDVTENFIKWARRVALIKAQRIDYICEDAKKFLMNSNEKFDLTSSFATIQWVMAQQGYQSGVDCFEQLFKRTRHIAVIEMGYTSEEIYKDKIKDRPSEIDRDWVRSMFNRHADFTHVEVHPSGENGIWRDLFIGYKVLQSDMPFLRRFGSDMFDHVSTAFQYWEDKWVGPGFEVVLRAKGPLKGGQIAGWIPDIPMERKSEIVVYLNDRAMQKVSAGIGHFSCDFKCQVAAGAQFTLKIRAPALKLTTSEDSRLLAFVLTGLSFS